MMASRVDEQRFRVLAEGTEGQGPVVYWMSRDQRARDNWALLHAQDLALRRGRPLVVAFCLVPGFLGATWRQYGFMLRGLRELEADLADRNVPFHLLLGEPGDRLPDLLAEHDATLVVTDFDPLRVKRRWRSEVAASIRVPLVEVDAHNIVPCWVASDKQEWAAYTLRPKLHRALPRFLTDLPELVDHPHDPPRGLGVADWAGAEGTLACDRRVGEVDWLGPGEAAGCDALARFVDHGLEDYPELRNDPSTDGQSGLSPYLHFGQLSAQRVALEVRGAAAVTGPAEAFLEELVVRRELADNFCHYNPHYDGFQGLPDWARKSLDDHRKDPREHLYTLEELEAAETHDDLWNAAQMEMVVRGKMHGYMRMYWAKKVLEWSPDPEVALERAIRLNDRYELDGRDPNGYTGVAWSVGGVHDRAWGERPVFGKVRFMSRRSTGSKFDSEAYIRHNL